LAAFSVETWVGLSYNRAGPFAEAAAVVMGRTEAQ
jgi:hypothetical protein